MCGICGIFSCSSPLSFLEVQMVKDLVYAMAHRGPDNSDTFTDSRIGLGISRLSIVDLDNGNQPLTNENNSLVLICNGEIYNYIELRQSLEDKGHRFNTRSDAEVILHLYEESGSDLLNDLAGMFAFALWDREKRILMLARDRVGIKPLYLVRTPEHIIFASELGPLVRNLNLRPDLLPEKTWEFLSYGFPVDNRQTLLKDVVRLCPGEACLISDTGEQFFTYWEPAYLKTGSDGPSNNTVENVEKLYKQAIAQHYRCDVPSALMLSGGLDSASIASLGNELGFFPRALTIGYEEDCPGDERQKAAAIAEICGIDTREIVLGYKEYVQGFETLIQHCDEPVADIAAIPQWKIFETAHQMGFKVLLNGLGGDEIFYGYGVWNDAVLNIASGLYNPLYQEGDVSGFLFHPAHRAARHFLRTCARPGFHEAGRGCDENLLERFSSPGLSCADQIYHLLLKTWLPNNCLLLADRLSMAHSVELRVPLLDHRLMDYVHGLSFEKRFFGIQGKVLLKTILSNRLPGNIVNMPKLGFTPPGKYMIKMIFFQQSLSFQPWTDKEYVSKGKA